MMPKSPDRSAEFAALWQRARVIANHAAVLQNAKLGAEGSRGFDCGFAWIVMDGNEPFARWARKTGLSSKAHPRGQQIWYSKVHDVPTQSVSVHEAACQAAAKFLQQQLGTSLIHSASRLD